MKTATKTGTTFLAGVMLCGTPSSTLARELIVPRKQKQAELTVGLGLSCRSDRGKITLALFSAKIKIHY